MSQKEEQKKTNRIKAQECLKGLIAQGFRIWEYTVRGDRLTVWLIGTDGAGFGKVIDLSKTKEQD